MPVPVSLGMLHKPNLVLAQSNKIDSAWRKVNFVGSSRVWKRYVKALLKNS